MTPIRRLLNIIQFDLAEKLNLARLRWYHLKQRTYENIRKYPRP